MFYNKKKYMELAPFGRYAHFHYSRVPDFLIMFIEHDRGTRLQLHHIFSAHTYRFKFGIHVHCEW